MELTAIAAPPHPRRSPERAPEARVWTGADVLAAHLAAAGCTRAFGIPGGEVLALIDSVHRAGIAFHLAKHENAAGFMAEGAWHADGGLPVLIATLGPGVANAVNVVANAMQDRVPLVFLTGCVDGSDAERYTHQVFDHQALLRPIVKASFRAAPGTVGLVAAKAMALALDGQLGPVHIDLPISVAEAAASEPPPARFAPREPSRFEAAGPVLEDAIDRLRAARRPLVIAGVDAVNEQAGEEIAAFCTRFGIPLVTTYKAKGILPERDPLAIGGMGLSPKADALVLPLLAQADFLLLLGYDPIEMRAAWRNPWPVDRTVIEIAPVLRAHGMHAISQHLHGRIAPTLARLARGLEPVALWPDAAPARTRAALQAAFAPGPGFGPAQVFATLRAAVPADAVATADSGAHRILLSQMWSCPAPRSLLQSTALCTMGCAVPLAAGVKLARPERAVLAVVGDAGLEMVLGELATLRDAGLAVIVVVLVDRSLALIELKQRGAQRPCVGVDFGATDFPAVAHALGGRGVWIDDTETLRREVATALAADTFSLLACRIGPRAYDGSF